MKCLICKKLIQGRRLTSWTKYCSEKCSKKACYLRNSKSKHYSTGDKDFWKTETGKGFKWERYSAKLLGAKHLEFNGKGADLDWNGKLVDVKSCEIYKRKFAHGKPTFNRYGSWIFHRNTNKPMDFFFCICLKNNKIIKKYLIPNEFFPKGVSIGKISPKYDKFIFKSITLHEETTC